VLLQAHAGKLIVGLQRQGPSRPNAPVIIITGTLRTPMMNIWFPPRNRSGASNNLRAEIAVARQANRPN